MEIKVTQDHIERGRTRCKTHCPVALAMRDMELPFAEATLGRLCYVEGGALMSAVPPPEAAKFMDDFDNGRPVGPVAFEFNPGRLG